MIEPTVAEHDSDAESANVLAVTRATENTENGTLMLKKVLITPLAASLSSLSLPISIIALEKIFTPSVQLSLAQKLSKTLPPYAALVVIRTWFLWYRIGARLDGKPDAEIETSDQAKEDVPAVVLGFMVANLSSLTNGMLIAFYQLKGVNTNTQLSVGLSLGLIIYLADLLTDVGDAFRKYAETEKVHHQRHIAPFFEQSVMTTLWDNHPKKLTTFLWAQTPETVKAPFIHAATMASNYIETHDNFLSQKLASIQQLLIKHSATEVFGMFFREISPILNGILRGRAFYDASNALIKDERFALFKMLCVLCVYEASAIDAKFDVMQLLANLKACQQLGFALENGLVRNDYKLIRGIGKFQNGQLLIDLFQKLCCSLNRSLNFTMGIAALGFMSLIFGILETYVSSTDTKAVAKGEEGLIANYYFSENQAASIAPSAMMACTGIAVTLGAVGIFTHTATIKEYANSRSQTTNTHQVFVTNTTEDNADRDSEITLP